MTEANKRDDAYEVCADFINRVSELSELVHKIDEGEFEDKVRDIMRDSVKRSAVSLVGDFTARVHAIHDASTPAAS